MPAKPTARSKRTQAFGQSHGLSWVDRFGIYLSERRIVQMLRELKTPQPVVMDVGCGYHARLMQRLAPRIQQGICVDLDLDSGLKQMGNIRLVRDSAERALAKIPKQSVDVMILNSVLEHITHPAQVLAAGYACLRPGGRMFVNVPTWLGKRFLEWSAFRMQWSPAAEMDDHKMYYNQRELWPLLVAAGFKPSGIQLRLHKFGLNCYAICKKA